MKKCIWEEYGVTKWWVSKIIPKDKQRGTLLIEYCLNKLFKAEKSEINLDNRLC